MAYELRVAVLFRQVAVDQQKAATLIAAGAKPDEHFPAAWLDSFEVRQAAFDESLAAEPQPQALSVIDELMAVA